MTRVFERRMRRVRATTNDAMARSPRVIWCFEPENMPATIELLIAQGRLSDADRPHCVHWSALKDARALSPEETSLMVDADEMLEQAGVRTVMAEGWEALMRSAEAFEAFMRARYGEPDADDIRVIQQLDRSVARLRSPPA